MISRLSPPKAALAALLVTSCLAAAARHGVKLNSIATEWQATTQGPKKLSKRGLQNVVAFTRLLGYVRYFHPSDAAAETDWDAFAIRGVREVESAVTASALATKLESLFHPIAHIRVFVTGSEVSMKLEPPKQTGGLRVLAWEHRGWGQPRSKGSPYSSERVEPHSISLTRLKGDAQSGPAFPDPLEPHRADLGGGVTCLVPIAVYADAKGTLPRLKVTARDASADSENKYSSDDRATRLAGVALAWSVLQHFYPYFDVVQTDWNAVLPRTLAAAATDADGRAYLDTLSVMIAQLHDGHGMVRPRSMPGLGIMRLAWAWIEDQLVITGIDTENRAGYDLDDIAVGDIVHAIDGKPIADVLTEKLRAISGATLRWRRRVSLSMLQIGDFRRSGELTVQTPGESARRRIPFSYMRGAKFLSEPRPEKVEELKPGIWYVDLDRTTDADLEAAKSDLAKARGIVFDLRGYPKATHQFLSHLTDKPISSQQWLIPRILYPDRRNMAFDEGQWQLMPMKPRFKAKAVFITDRRAISAAETYLALVKHHRLAEIVGEATAGTNGNVNPFVLPGGYAVVWTGMKVLNQDGSRHHGVGIKPTIPMKRTVAGVKAERDELLERAIEVASRR